MVSDKGDVLMKKINIAIAFMLLISLVYSPVHADEVKEVYLTFDDGPSHNTPQVLDILDKYNVKATFFVTGENARYQSYIRTAYLKGHAIGAHSYTHKYSPIATPLTNILHTYSDSFHLLISSFQQNA